MKVIKSIEEAIDQFKEMEKQFHHSAQLLVAFRGTSDFARAMQLFEKCKVELIDAARVWGAVEMLDRWVKEKEAEAQFQGMDTEQAPAQAEMH